ncbi:hypothetical protein HOLleu_15745 [Holothuria leucospilota]|uniref:Uncharacterized protein n=1 Tax=Holothuria leucospilota TaxID=206669 RepID=A0A9Q1C560_HOLLE|nr:hypothetical protein HOLleu_15745 [Holothuria leucospilota]
MMGEVPVHLLFDTDALDPVFAPGTGKLDQTLKIHKTIYERHEGNQSFRDTKQTSIPIVYIVEKGGFLKLQEFILANSSTARAQFKMPLKLRTREMGEILLKQMKM